ncbi:unnamed protein product [Cyprideis torosa]|uniref:Uncharacterized protein n=1 Tax=Cyprideis torosa TaxID=163714 RepID=A0A7R8ZPN1_9CRUS|nr:unnamed protein product [Cyprideis torosa]CAG0900952.1 unnamed protein product [Cyprideis torosa]
MMQSRECDTTLEPTTEDETPVEIAGTGDVLRAELVETFSRGTFTDLVLVCGGGSIPCHQAVLATHSSFIANILYQTSSCVCLEEEVSFLQSDSSDHTKWTSRGKAESLQLPSFQSVATILLPDFSLDLVRSLLHFCYSGSVLLDKKNIASLVSLADLLEMDLVKELIAEGRKLFRKANVKKKAKQTPASDSLNQSVVSSRWNCLVCQRTFRYEAKLNRHMQLVHTGSVIPCRHCGKTEFSQGSLTEHMRQDHPLKNFVCTLCAEERRFRRKASLLEHLRSVHPNAVNEAAQPYICDIPGSHEDAADVRDEEEKGGDIQKNLIEDLKIGYLLCEMSDPSPLISQGHPSFYTAIRFHHRRRTTVEEVMRRERFFSNLYLDQRATI